MKKQKNRHEHRVQKRSSKQALSPNLFVYSVVGVIGVVAVIGLTQTFSQVASLRLDSPKLLSRTSVLGDGDENEKEHENEQKAEEKQREEQKKEEEQKSQELQHDSEKSSDDKTSTSQSSGKSSGSENKNETEIETVSGQKIKTKIEDNGTTKIEIEHGELKIKYEFENDEVVKTVENEDGDIVNLEDDELEHMEKEIETELEDEGIEISTESGKPTVIKNRIAASTEFPLSVDVGTNQLILTTAEGQRVIAVLPDQAMQNLLATGIINSVNLAQTSDTPTEQTQTSIESLMHLKVRDGEPVYEIEGTKVFRLFAVIPVAQPIKAIVSAETGNLVTKQQSLLTNIIDLLSP